jgi:hypothetical protein
MVPNEKNKFQAKPCCRRCRTFKIIYGDKKGYYCENCVPVVNEFQRNPAKADDGVRRILAGFGNVLFPAHRPEAPETGIRAHA